MQKVIVAVGIGFLGILYLLPVSTSSKLPSYETVQGRASPLSTILRWTWRGMQAKQLVDSVTDSDQELEHHHYPSSQVWASVDFTVGSVQGELILNQYSDTAPVLIHGVLNNLTAGLHGFHVHESGDLSRACDSTGGHFNPDNVDHGAPSDTTRHAGDLGNIRVGSDGTVYLKISDRLLSLQGPRSIIGRAFVVHADEDDLGKGGHEDSKRTGHAGPGIGCGVVVLPLSSTANSWAAHLGQFHMGILTLGVYLLLSFN